MDSTSNALGTPASSPQHIEPRICDSRPKLLPPKSPGMRGDPIGVGDQEGARLTCAMSL
jgi:hypothetical protein